MPRSGALAASQPGDLRPALSLRPSQAFRLGKLEVAVAQHDCYKAVLYVRKHLPE